MLKNDEKTTKEYVLHKGLLCRICAIQSNYYQFSKRRSKSLESTAMQTDQRPGAH